MGIGVCTALSAFTQLSSITEGFKLCWRSGQKAHLETILFGRSNPPSHSFSFFFFVILALYQLFINCGVVWYTAVFCICVRFFSTEKGAVAINIYKVCKSSSQLVGGWGSFASCLDPMHSAIWEQDDCKSTAPTGGLPFSL